MECLYFLEDCNKIFKWDEKEYIEHLQLLYTFLPQTLKDKNITKSTLTCNHILQSGSRRFQICGNVVNEENTDKCEKHVIKLNPNLIKNKIQSKKIIIIKNKYDHFLWPDTKLILKSSKEKYIVGVEDEKGEQIELSVEDIELCNKLKLKYKI